MPRTLRISGELDFLRVENIFATSHILREYIKSRLMHCIEFAECYAVVGATTALLPAVAVVIPEWS